MRAHSWISRVLGAAVGAALALARVSPSAAAAAAPQPVDSSTWVDHDGLPVPEPRDREKALFASQFREAIVEPLSHAFDIPDKILWLLGPLGASSKHSPANINAFDEVANSTWFTNRNHVRALPLSEIRNGPGGELRPTPPYTVTKPKTEGVNPGFQIKDAAGKKWFVKLDTPSYPQLGSGADAISSRLLWAAGFNLPHDVWFRFRPDELAIDPDLAAGKKGKPFHDVDLTALLARGHRYADGSSSAEASLFLEGKPIGPIDSRSHRQDDANDVYTHKNRRELRGLYVLMSWLNSWDTKDQQTLDMYIAEKDQPGFVRHNLIDVGASLGAQAEGPKDPVRGFEYTIDWGWMMRRLLTLGFVEEPWRHAHQETGIPSVGNLEYQVYEPDDFRSLQPHPAFHERTLSDGYWGAKLVASFSDAQIAAAVEGARYEDPRATEFLTRALIARRDMVARYWFGKVTPADFFAVGEGELRFHDLAVDRGLSSPRHYRIRVHPDRGRDRALDVDQPRVALSGFDPSATRVTLEITAQGLGARPAEVELRRVGDAWALARVQHAD